MLAHVGNEDQTFDELFEAQHFKSLGVVNEALNDLLHDGKLGERTVECGDQGQATTLLSRASLLFRSGT